MKEFDDWDNWRWKLICNFKNSFARQMFRSLIFYVMNGNDRVKWGSVRQPKARSAKRMLKIYWVNASTDRIRQKCQLFCRRSWKRQRQRRGEWPQRWKICCWCGVYFIFLAQKKSQTFYTKKHIEETYKLKLKLKLEQNVLISGKFFRWDCHRYSIVFKSLSWNTHTS